MDWEITIKGLDDEQIYVNKEILENKYLILNTKGFSIVDLDQIIIKSMLNNEENNIINRNKMLEHLDSYIEKVYDYAYTLAENFANNNDYKIK